MLPAEKYATKKIANIFGGNLGEGDYQKKKKCHKAQSERQLN